MSFTLKYYAPIFTTIALALLSLFSYSNVYAEEPPVKLQYWEKLLHYDGERSPVVSKSFFLSETGMHDSLEELNDMIALLNSNKGGVLACNYPARYTWIRSQGLEVPEFDLSKCQELSEYVSNFQKESLYLVYASEYVDSAASAFGHILLVFRDQDKPLLTADTIHFAAETPRDSLLKYIYSGLSGGYYGYFFRTPFHVIGNSYTVLQQRGLYFFKLDTDEEQIEFLIYHLFELRKARYNYFFLRENCAYQIATLLEIVYADSEVDLLRNFFVLPLEIVDYYKSRSVDNNFIESTMLRAQRIFEQMTVEEIEIYSAVKKGDLSVRDDLPDTVKEIVAIEHEYMFRRFRKVMPDYDESIRLRFNNNLPATASFQLDTRSNKNMLGVGLYSDEESLGLYLKYMLVGRDIYENQYTKQQESHLTLMDTQVVVLDDNVRLQQLDVVSVNSLFNKIKLLSTFSWNGTVSINRLNTLNQAKFDMNFGLGKGYGGKRMGFNLQAAIGLQDSARDGREYIKPSLTLVYYPTNKVKLGIIGSMKYASYNNYKESTGFVNIDFRKLSITAKHSRSNSALGNYSIISIGHHF